MTLTSRRRTPPRADPQPRHSPVDLTRGTRLLLALFAALTLLGFVALFGLAEHTDRYFAWTVDPQLTAAFYGAGYGAGCVLVLLALRERAWSRVRLAAATIFVFAALSLVATLRHLHRFHLMDEGLARVAAWLWLAVYVVVPLALLVAIVVEQRRTGVAPPRSRPLPAWLAVVLAAQGAALLLAGLLVLLAQARAGAIWPWSLTPLTGGMVAAWLVAFGVAAGLALLDRDLDRLRTPAVAYLVFAVLQLTALARYRDQVRWAEPSAVAYAGLLVVMALTGAYGWWAARRPVDTSARTGR